MELVTVKGRVLKTRLATDRGFRVLFVQREDGVREGWAGDLPAVDDASEVTATGAYEETKYGLQLKVTTLRVEVPTGKRAIAAYLASGNFPGIGPKLAERVAAHFGDSVFAALDASPERIREVRGVSAKTAEVFSGCWTEKRAVHAIMTWLYEHGAPGHIATQIFERFGEKAIEVVSKRPYALALQVRGVGFLTADRIAQSLGVGFGSPERAQAGVLHVLGEESSLRGHVWMSRDDLARSTAEMLGASPGDCYEAIEALDGTKVTVEGGQVFGRNLCRAERRLADCLRRLLSTPFRVARAPGAPPAPELSTLTEKVLPRFESDRSITLAPAQRAAIESAALHKVLVITGGPGVGKTTIVRALLALFDAGRAAVRLAAPTGAAARRMSDATGREATTIHRLLEYNPRHGFGRTCESPIEADVVIVDEASMLDTELAARLVDAVAPSARLIFVGDVDQLPSVGPGAVLRDVIASGVVPVARLSTIYRQAEGSQIVDNAHRINRGEAPVAADDFWLVPCSEATEAADHVERIVNEELPRRGFDPIRDVQVLAPMHNGEAGVRALNQRLQASLNPANHGLRHNGQDLRVGDKVMQLRNDYERGIANGDYGFVVEADPEDRRLLIDMNGQRLVCDSKHIGALTLSYAATVHKSQGSEYPVVVLVLLRAHHVMLTRPLFYTAATRGKRLVVVVGDPAALKVALRQSKRAERRTGLVERLQQGAA